MTTPDPTAVAAVAADEIDEIADVVSCTLPEWVSILQGWGSLEEREAAMRHIATNVQLAINKHRAAQAAEADRELVANHMRVSVRHRLGEADYGDVIASETALLARLAQRPAPAIDRAGWSMAVTRLEQAAENASWGSWDYEANQRAGKEKNDALKALDALVAPFLAKEEQ